MKKAIAVICTFALPAGLTGCDNNVVSENVGGDRRHRACASVNSSITIIGYDGNIFRVKDVIEEKQ